MTASEYLAWERMQLERHEYFRGEVFLMAGGSPRHNALSAAIIRDLGVATRRSRSTRSTTGCSSYRGMSTPRHPPALSRGTVAPCPPRRRGDRRSRR
jgi:Uma2 family endonuclease